MRLRCVAEDILSQVEEMAEREGVSCQGLLVGSAARNTWLAGDHDLDIFLAVPEEGDLGEALRLARKLAPIHQEKYAEHAYIRTIIDGFEVDLVPCYALKDASRIKSAVDRTPFHSRYVAERIQGLEDQVLLLKQFMKGVGVYGSELRVGGFSGYLVELLVLNYRSFLGTLEAADLWCPGQIIDLESHSLVTHQDPLIVVDPVDPKRNVAAALTLDKMFRFVAAARCFLRSPGEEFFFPPKRSAFSGEDLRSKIMRRGTSLMLVEFPAPDVVEDVLFPQLRKAEESVRTLMMRNGFSVMRSEVAWHDGSKVNDLPPRANGLARMLFELDVWQLPRIQKHFGPPLWEREHLSRFLESHPEPISGPYIEDGRAVVEISRKYTTARELLMEEMGRISLGKHLAAQVRNGYNIYVGEEILSLEDKPLRAFLSEFLEARGVIC
jgi:tRNA nucleotidyltransferase (CCA-adding enzyme)